MPKQPNSQLLKATAGIVNCHASAYDTALSPPATTTPAPVHAVWVCPCVPAHFLPAVRGTPFFLLLLGGGSGPSNRMPSSYVRAASPQLVAARNCSNVSRSGKAVLQAARSASKPFSRRKVVMRHRSLRHTKQREQTGACVGVYTFACRRCTVCYYVGCITHLRKQTVSLLVYVRPSV